MLANIVIVLVTFISVFSYIVCHTHEPHVMTSVSHLDEREHIGEHMKGIVDISNVDQMSEEELRFLYFKMHDSDENNMLDGSELLKSVLHWHNEEHKAIFDDESNHGTTRIFHHDELSMMIDPILDSDDKNTDGFIDYSEFVAGQKSRGFY